MAWGRSSELSKLAWQKLGVCLKEIRLRTEIRQDRVGALDPESKTTTYGKAERGTPSGLSAKMLGVWLREIKAKPDEEWQARFLLGAAKSDDEFVQRELLWLTDNPASAKARAAPGKK